jgi:hypothetical protein
MAPITVVLSSLLYYILSAFIWVLIFILEHTTEVVWATACAVGAWFTFRYVLSFRVTLHPATSQVFSEIVRRFQEESMLSDAGCPAVAVGEDVDVDLTPEPVRKDIKLVRSHRRVPYAIRVAHLAKAQVGLLANTKANELVYARICRDEMVKHGLRPSHIAHMVPIATAACFVPLDEDFLAASLRQCSEMTARRALLGPIGSK